MKEPIMTIPKNICTQSIQAPTNAALSPKASLIHLYTPPAEGHPVASSAEIRAVG